jgi:hypothetical protein
MAHAILEPIQTCVASKLRIPNRTLVLEMSRQRLTSVDWLVLHWMITRYIAPRPIMRTMASAMRACPITPAGTPRYTSLIAITLKKEMVHFELRVAMLTSVGARNRLGGSWRGHRQISNGRPPGQLTCDIWAELLSAEVDPLISADQWIVRIHGQGTSEHHDWWHRVLAQHLM